MASFKAAKTAKSKTAKAETKAKPEAQPRQPEQCLRCGEFVTELHCKVLCTNCGYMRDCNDQW